MELKELQKLVMDQAKAKGFGTKEDEVIVAEKIALIHSEVSEMYEAYRKKKQGEFEEELGDVIQRVLHLAGIFKIDVEKEILKKLEKNESRKWDKNKFNEGII